MNEYHFSAELAQKYGLDEAIMLHNLAYWVQKNTIDGRNIHDGRAWTYNSQESFREWFPFWTRRQIQRVLKSLEDQQAIIKGNYNVKPMDRTLWYTVSDGILAYYGIREPEEHDSVPSIDANGAIDGTKPCDETHETVPAIPKNKHKEKTKDTLTECACVDQEQQFALFWERYPRKTDKKKAREVWQRLHPDPALFAQIMAGLDRHLRSEQWQRGVIPHPTTWLNRARWEDELDLPTPPDGPRRIEPGEGWEYV